MAFTVVLRPQAEEDLATIYEYIAQSNPQRAIEYLRRLRLRCEALTYFRSEAAPEMTSCRAHACSHSTGAQ